MDEPVTGNSRFIASAQDGPHHDLEALVRRHMVHSFMKPFADYNREAFALAMAAREAWNPQAPQVWQTLMAN